MQVPSGVTPHVPQPMPPLLNIGMPMLSNPLLSIGQGLLDAGGYSSMPISTGQGLAAGLRSWQQQQQADMQRQLAMARLAELQDERNRRLAEQQQREEARKALQREVEARAASDPRYSAIQGLAAVPGFEDVTAQAYSRLATQQPTESRPLVVGKSLVDPATGQVIYREPAERSAPRGVVVDGRIVDPATGRVIYEGGGPGGGAQAKYTDESSARKEFLAESRTWTDTRDAYERLNASRESGPGDIALLTGYMKMLDPGSVVREGEFATAQNASGVPAQIRGLYNRLVNGERLTPDLRQEFKGQARDILATAARTHAEREAQYKALATDRGFKPQNVARDLLGPYRNLIPALDAQEQVEQRAAKAEQLPAPTRRPVTVERSFLAPQERSELDRLKQEFAIP